MKLVTLKFPLGRSVQISHEAAEIAIAIDRLKVHPILARQIMPALGILKQSVALIDQVERTSGKARLNEMIAESFPTPESP